MALAKHYLRKSAKCHGMILPSMLGISWASTVIPHMEHGMIIESDSIQTASEKCLVLSDHSSLISSLRSVSLRGSGEEVVFEEMNGDISIISSNRLWSS